MADTQVFGKRAGESAAKNALSNEFELTKIMLMQRKKEFVTSLKMVDIYPHQIKTELMETMWENVAIIRNEDGLKIALNKIEELKLNL